MKKIMLNDRYCLTQAVIEGKKTMTRREVSVNVNAELKEYHGDSLWYELDGVQIIAKPPYKVGEVVAVAQSYSSIARLHEDVDYFASQVAKAHECRIVGVQFNPGWCNKMYVRADLMPHQIRITGVRAKRLQDITDEECIKESIGYAPREGVYAWDGRCKGYSTPRAAFASLIDKVSGKGTWDCNPWVWVYEFELVK